MADSVQLLPPIGLQDDLGLFCQQMKDLRRHVESGMFLPITANNFQDHFFLDQKDVEQMKLDGLMSTYSDIRTHCINFRSEVFPSTARLASSIYHFARNFGWACSMMFRAVGRAPDRRKMMFTYACQDVLEEVSVRQALISQSIVDLERFEVDVLSDCSAAEACRIPLQHSLEETGEHFKKLKDEISNLKSLASGEDKKVERSYWMTFVGWVSKSILSDPSGKRSAQYIIDLTTNREKSETKLVSLEMVKLQLDLAIDELENASKSIGPAIETIQKIKAHFDAIKHSMDELLARKEFSEDIMSSGLISVLTKWDELREFSDALRQLVFDSPIHAETFLSGRGE